MPSASLHESSDQSAEVAHRNDARREERPGSVRITVIVQNRYMFDSHRATGRQIRETAGVPADFALYRRGQGANEPIADDAQVELHNGDHFFARPRKLGSESPSSDARAVMTRPRMLQPQGEGHRRR